MLDFSFFQKKCVFLLYSLNLIIQKPTWNWCFCSYLWYIHIADCIYFLPCDCWDLNQKPLSSLIITWTWLIRFVVMYFLWWMVSQLGKGWTFHAYHQIDQRQKITEFISMLCSWPPWILHPPLVKADSNEFQIDRFNNFICFIVHPVSSISEISLSLLI